MYIDFLHYNNYYSIWDFLFSSEEQTFLIL